MAVAILLIRPSAVRSVAVGLRLHSHSRGESTRGETKCVAGKVLKIRIGNKGAHFLDFCEDQMACPFTVVVFPSGLKDFGDVRRLEGRAIEIHGTVKLYDGRPEIILNRISQITGGAAMIPRFPKITT